MKDKSILHETKLITNFNKLTQSQQDCIQREIINFCNLNICLSDNKPSKCPYCHKNTYAVICDHGKPSASRIFEVLKNHIVSGSTLVHDGERAHDKLIKELDLKEEFYKANTHDKEYLENMALINNMCSWLKRYIYRFIGMRMANLQSYLNWFVYLFRVKGAVEQWTKMDRIRHLILFNGTYKRNT